MAVKIEAASTAKLAVVSATQAVLVCVGATVVLVMLGELLGHPGVVFSVGDVLASAAYTALLAACCFLICRRNPRSVWYVPVLGNGSGIVAAVVEPNFWSGGTWVLQGLALGLSVVAAAGGARRGKRDAGR